MNFGNREGYQPSLFRESQLSFSMKEISRFLSEDLHFALPKKEDKSAKSKDASKDRDDKPKVKEWSAFDNLRKEKNQLKTFLLPNVFRQKEDDSRKRRVTTEYNVKSTPKRMEVIKRRPTSYRERKTILTLESNSMANLVFNRTQKLLMFGAFGSTTEAVSDDEYEGGVDFLGTRFNPLGNIIDELSHDDNVSNSDIETMAKYPGKYSANDKNKAMNIRTAFLSKLHEKQSALSLTKKLFDIKFDFDFAKHQIQPIDYAEFFVMSQILSELKTFSSVMRDDDSIFPALKSYSEFLNKVIRNPGAKSHLICSELTLKFIFITHDIVANLSYGLRKNPYSLFAFIVDRFANGFEISSKYISKEAQLIAKQIDIGGLYCHELNEYKTLAFCTRLDHFEENIDSQLYYIGSKSAKGLARISQVGPDEPTYSLRYGFCLRRSLFVTAEIIDTGAPRSLMPLYNMFDYSNRNAGETNRIVIFPW